VLVLVVVLVLEKGHPCVAFPEYEDEDRFAEDEYERSPQC
jgi:hypothetical protein